MPEIFLADTVVLSLHMILTKLTCDLIWKEPAGILDRNLTTTFLQSEPDKEIGGVLSKSIYLSFIILKFLNEVIIKLLKCLF